MQKESLRVRGRKLVDFRLVTSVLKARNFNVDLLRTLFCLNIALERCLKEINDYSTSCSKYKEQIVYFITDYDRFEKYEVKERL